MKFISHNDSYKSNEFIFNLKIYTNRIVVLNHLYVKLFYIFFKYEIQFLNIRPHAIM